MSSSTRFFSNPSTPLRTVDASAELEASLDRITTHHPPVHTCSTGWSFQGFYGGPTSIAYLFFKLSRIFPRKAHKQQSLFDWAEAYLALGARLEKNTPDPDHCGIASETLAHLALSAVMRGDGGLAKQLCAFEGLINGNEVGGSDEWMYGRAGYLYFLRLCRTAFGAGVGEDSTAALLDATISNTVSRILSAPRPWSWHGKEYFGAAHGAIGIICQLVLSQPGIAPELEGVLSDLLATQLPSGNFPSSAGSESDRLVQFCHGGPGFVISLCSLGPHFPALKRRIRRAVELAVADTWERGLLVKEPCLCHGIAGNALALATGGAGEEKFEHFLAFMDTESMEKVGWMRRAGRDDSFAGLYTGEAGRAWVWGVKASRGMKVCIGYNDL
ncbi:hypothetical protein F5Y00DRAFT_249913 [Daldinia vernicosa]|uniref:uncharacterized protein n=1 Tax=Daldinia vernicosa TaxID=114800 RepID=UPI002008A164|nr:uncharacterized protein F5Y00DRAFT_249913 [Daldinia vernicosa]KAI0843932.1 hypothetical protein F5Y00DRAFT_249913 [Daldinia vernicosa]